MKALFFLLLFVVAGCSSFGQQAPAFIRFSTDDNSGLSANVVYSIYQDEKGYIWVGTANGLQRFEGNRFNLFSIDQKVENDRFPNSPLTQIVSMGNNNLMLHFPAIGEIGIFNPVKLTYRRVKVTVAQVRPRTEYRIWKDSKGELFLNMQWVGLLHYNRAMNAFIDDNYFSLPKGYFPAGGGIFDDSLTQRVWFGGVQGLRIYDRKTRQLWSHTYNPKRMPILDNAFVNDFPTQIYIDKARRHWIFGWPKGTHVGHITNCLDSNGVFLHQDTVGLRTGLKGYTEYNNITETKRGIWIYGNANLFRWNNRHQRFQILPSTVSASNNGIEYDQVFQLLEDNDRNLWLATDKGLYFTSSATESSPIVNYIFDGSKGGVSVEDVLEMPNGDLWFACWGQGVIILDSALRERRAALYTEHPSSDWAQPFISSLTGLWTIHHQKKTDDVWLGCQGGVMIIHNLRTGKNRYLLIKETGPSTIRYINEDKWGTIWLSTQNGRLLKWDGQKFSVALDIGTIIYKVFIDDEGLMWLTTENLGVYCLEARTAKILKHYMADGTPNSIIHNSGQDIDQLHDGTLVYGGGALNFINKKAGQVRQFGFREGLPSSNVYRVRVDAQGHLWVVTANGLCRYDPFRKRITLYGKKDGITIANRTSKADFLLEDGRVLFAGENGAMLFNPRMFVASQPPPNVVITDFRLVDQFIPVDSLLELPQITLSSGQNSFTINFSSLSFGQSNRLTYFYKMEGIDKEWQLNDGLSAQNYSLLPPGKYVFKVYAENIEGQRSAKTTELHILVKPPFWKTKWFISSALFLTLLLIYILHRERVNKLLAVEKIRNKVARDLHDDMGSTLSTINILSSMAKSKMSSDPVKTAGYLGKISDNSQRMMEAMDDIVWSIKPSNDSMQRVTARMREFATNVLEAKDIALNFLVSEEVYAVKLNMEARRDFFLIFKEALNNSAKYAKATQVKVEVKVNNRFLMVTVCDNGQGFKVDLADGGNGLGNMQKRADGMNGRLTIHSEIGIGTEVRLRVPVA